MRLFALLLVAGCGAELGSNSNNGTVVDAPNGGSNNNNGVIDAPLGGSPDAPASACANGRVVYLSFEGETLTQATTTDSTQNHAAWIGVTTATVPAFHPGLTNRATAIQTIVDGVKSRLSPTPIQVVTTRPAAGPYVMVVLGGANTDVGSQYTYATSDHDCGDTVKNDVAWVSDAPSLSYVPDLIVGAIGWGLGLQGTSDTGDCMCGWANSCSSNSGACSLSASIATTASSNNTTCPGENPQNEIAAFSTQFCQ